MMASPTVSVKDQLLKRGPNSLIKYKQRKASVVHDFPMGCAPSLTSTIYRTGGPNVRFAPQLLENSVYSEMPCSRDLLDSKDSVVSFGEKGLELLASMEHEGIEYPKASSEHEATDLSKKDTVKIMPKVYPPRRKISAVRCFPEGCGPEAPWLSKIDASQAIANKTNGLEDMMSIAKDTFLDEATGRDSHERSAVTTSRSNLSQAGLKRHNQDTKCLDNYTEKKRVKMENCPDKQKLPINCGSTNQLPAKESIGMEIPVHRSIVQGLMAGSRCPWRQRERLSQTFGHDQDTKCLDNDVEKKCMKIEKCPDEKLPVNCGSTNELPVKVSIGMEIQVHRPIVQGLMAGSRCPWRQREKLSQRKAKGNSINLQPRKRKM